MILIVLIPEMSWITRRKWRTRSSLSCWQSRINDVSTPTTGSERVEKAPRTRHNCHSIWRRRFPTTTINISIMRRLRRLSKVGDLERESERERERERGISCFTDQRWWMGGRRRKKINIGRDICRRPREKQLFSLRKQELWLWICALLIKCCVFRVNKFSYSFWRYQLDFRKKSGICF